MAIKKNILVTGGLGYIGAHVCIELIKNGYNPIIVDNGDVLKLKKVHSAIEKWCRKKIIWYKVKLQGNSLLPLQERIHAIIHLAAYKSVPESMIYPEMYYDNNINSTLAVVNFALRRGGIPIIFSSSCSVYGKQTTPFTENALLLPLSPYAETKVICEQIIKNCKLPGFALRYFNPVGINKIFKPKYFPNKTQTILSAIREAKITGKKVIINGIHKTPDNSPVRDFITINDIAKAHIRSLTKTHYFPSFKAINIGTGKGISVKQLCEITQVQYTIGPSRDGDVSMAWADNTMAKTVLKMKFAKSVKKAILSEMT